MPKFTYSDLVRVRPGVSTWFDVPGRRTTGPRIGEPASVYAITEDRRLGPRPEFPAGVIYGVEFDDGDAIEVHEDDLEPAA
jgi:hypothetical protein